MLLRPPNIEGYIVFFVCTFVSNNDSDETQAMMTKFPGCLHWNGFLESNVFIDSVAS